MKVKKLNEIEANAAQMSFEKSDREYSLNKHE